MPYKTFFRSLIAATLLLAGNSLASDKPPAPTGDEIHAEAVLESLAQAWNAHDMDKHAELFAPDAVWVNIRGNRWVGREAIKRNHLAVHELFFAESTVAFTDIAVRMIAPGVAVVHAKETITGSNMPPAAGVGPDSQMSLVVVRGGDRWLIENGQNTNVAAPPPQRP